jgi:hypothetical protein
MFTVRFFKDYWTVFAGEEPVVMYSDRAKALEIRNELLAELS